MCEGGGNSPLFFLQVAQGSKKSYPFNPRPRTLKDIDWRAAVKKKHAPGAYFFLQSKHLNPGRFSFKNYLIYLDFFNLFPIVTYMITSYEFYAELTAFATEAEIEAFELGCVLEDAPSNELTDEDIEALANELN